MDGHRYFYCRPNRGLFVRITRCRTRAGHSVDDGRHVSFPSRTLGKRVDGDGWNANVKSGSSPPYLSLSRRAGTSPVSSDAHQPQREESRVDAQPQAKKCKKWVSVGVSETGARRNVIRLESDSSETSSSESSSAESSSSESSSSGSNGSEVKRDYRVSRQHGSETISHLFGDCSILPRSDCGMALRAR